MGDKGRKSNFLTQGIILAAASVIVRLIGLVYRIPLARIIGEDGLGSYSNAYEVYNIALLLSTYSIPTAISKLISEREGKKEYKNSYHMFRVGLVFSIILGTIASLVLFLGADFVSKTIYKEADLSTAIPLRVLAPTILVFSVMGVIRGFFQGKNTVLPTSVSQILEQIVNAVVSVVAADLMIHSHSASKLMSAYGAAGGTLGTLLGAIAAFLFLAFIYLIYRPYQLNRLKKDKIGAYEDHAVLLKILFITTLPIILNQTVYSISSFLDSVLLNQIFDMKGIEETVRRTLFGRYSGKYRLMTNVPIAVASAIGMAVIPSIVEANLKRERKLLKDRISQAIKLNMMIAIPSAFGMAALARPIMQFIFKDTGDSLAMTSKMMVIGASSIVFFAYSTATNSVLQGIGRLRIPVIHGALSLVVYLLLDLVLLIATPLGVYSLVIGNLVFPLCISALNFRTLKNELHFRQEFDRTFLRTGLCSAFMAIVAYIVYTLLFFICKRNSIALILAIFVAMFTYFVMMIVFRGVTKEELREMPKGNTLVRLAKKLHLLS